MGKNQPYSKFRISEILLPYQKRVFFDETKFIIMNCSRQIGKSFTLSGKAYRKSLLNPKSLFACVSTGERAATEFLYKVKMWAEAVKKVNKRFDYRSSATCVELYNGSRIITLPAGNVNALRGWSGNIILDEFGLVQNDVELWKAVVPLITNRINNPDKSIWIASTPTGLNTQFAKIWFNDDDVGLWSKYKITIEDAVNDGLDVDVPELKKIVNDDLIWKTEYLCEFCSDSSEFVDLSVLQSYDTNISNINGRWCIGIDIGRKKDLTAILLAKKCAGITYVDQLITLKDTPYNDQMNIIRGLNRKYNIESGYIDATGIGSVLGEEIPRTINSRIKPLTFTASNKSDLYDSLRVNLCNHNMIFNKEIIETVKRDVCNVRRYVSNTGKITYSAGRDENGHSDITSGLVLLNKAGKELEFKGNDEPFSYKRFSVFG